MFCRNVRNDEILPDGETQDSGTEAIRDARECLHLRDWQSADGNRDADVVEPGWDCG